MKNCAVFVGSIIKKLSVVSANKEKASSKLVVDQISVLHSGVSFLDQTRLVTLEFAIAEAVRVSLLAEFAKDSECKGLVVLEAQLQHRLQTIKDKAIRKAKKCQVL